MPATINKIRKIVDPKKKGKKGYIAGMALFLGVSVYQIRYWLNWLRRRPGADLGPLEGYLQAVSDTETMSRAREARDNLNQSIISGKINSDNPVVAAETLRQSFKKVHGMMPEDIN